MAGALAGCSLAGGNTVESPGMRPMDAGALPMARALENAPLLHPGLVAHSVKHTDFAIGVLS
jgi:predicted dinucleotide-binding enzyme